MDGIKSLLKSRKFWIAVFGVIQSLVFYFLDVPATIWGAIDVLAVVLINAIATEDAALKSAGGRYGK